MPKPYTPPPTGTIRGPLICRKNNNRWFQFAVRKPDGTSVYVEDQNVKAAERKAKETRDKIFQP